MTSWDKQYKTGHGRYFPNEELCRFLGRTYGPVTKQDEQKGTAVEIGCGVGGNIIALGMYKFFSYGLDKSLEALIAAKSYLSRRYNSEYGVYKLVPYSAPASTKLPANSVQLVIDIHTIQHLDERDHEVMYEEIRRILVRDGKFFSVHWRGTQEEQQAIFPDHPELYCADKQVPFIIMQSVGLKIKSVHTSMRIYPNSSMGTWLIIEAYKP